MSLKEKEDFIVWLAGFLDGCGPNGVTGDSISVLRARLNPLVMEIVTQRLYEGAGKAPVPPSWYNERAEGIVYQKMYGYTTTTVGTSSTTEK